MIMPGLRLTGLQNQKPAGADTSGVARPKLGSVLYGGAGVYDCKRTGDIALTFDDGPYLYTNDLLDKLKVGNINLQGPKLDANLLGRATGPRQLSS